jgi:hypothetical protein
VEGERFVLPLQLNNAKKSRRYLDKYSLMQYRRQPVHTDCARIYQTSEEYVTTQSRSIPLSVKQSSVKNAKYVTRWL